MEPWPAPRELVFVAKPSAGLRIGSEGVFSVFGESFDSLKSLLSSPDVSVEPLFGLSEDLLENRVSILAMTQPDLSLFYKISAPDEELEELADRLRGESQVLSAYIKPGVELPLIAGNKPDDGAMLLPPNTDDLHELQIYLSKANQNLNAFSAWELPGGGGRDITIIDIEGAWRFSHEDLKENQGGVVGGTQTPCLHWRNHGTAVLGVLSGDRNNGTNFGILGISPEANVKAVSVFGQPSGHFPKKSGTAAAIRQAADLLNAGDILVLELQSPGPRHNFAVREDQLGYIPVEWWPDNIGAIRYALKRGVIVVEAAANGDEDLDDPIYNQTPGPPYGPFPPNWSNPFQRKPTDLSPIVVGAGAPLPHVNNSNWGPDRSRLSFSNYGSMVDAQGWGHEVTTCGFGNLQKGKDEDRWYKLDFGGTSSATPMVAGALACVQGAMKAAGKQLLTPAHAREVLHKTGFLQAPPEEYKRIGNRPNIMQMIDYVW